MYLYYFLLILVIFHYIEIYYGIRISLLQLTTLSDPNPLRFDYLPIYFWISSSQVVFKTYDGKYLLCNEKKEIDSTDNFTAFNKTNLYFMLHFYPNKYFKLETKNDTFLGYDKKTDTFSCKLKKENPGTLFLAEDKGNNTIQVFNKNNKYLFSDKNEPIKSQFFYPHDLER
jgi:hypothetical protein